MYLSKNSCVDRLVVPTYMDISFDIPPFLFPYLAASLIPSPTD